MTMYPLLTNVPFGQGDSFALLHRVSTGRAQRLESVIDHCLQGGKDNLCFYIQIFCSYNTRIEGELNCKNVNHQKINSMLPVHQKDLS